MQYRVAFPPTSAEMFCSFLIVDRGVNVFAKHQEIRQSSSSHLASLAKKLY